MSSKMIQEVHESFYNGMNGKIKTFAIITPNNPIDTEPNPKTPKKNQEDKKGYTQETKTKFTGGVIERQKAIKEIKTGLGYGNFSYVPISGEDETSEKSYFIINLSLKDAKALARGYAQESFLFGKTSPEGSIVGYYKTKAYGINYNLVETSEKITDKSCADDFYSKFGCKVDVDFDKFVAELTKDYRVDKDDFGKNLEEAVSDNHTFLNRAYFRRRLVKD